MRLFSILGGIGLVGYVSISMHAKNLQGSVQGSSCEEICSLVRTMCPEVTGYVSMKRTCGQCQDNILRNCMDRCSGEVEGVSECTEACFGPYRLQPMRTDCGTGDDSAGSTTEDATRATVDDGGLANDSPVGTDDASTMKSETKTDVSGSNDTAETMTDATSTNDPAQDQSESSLLAE